MRQNSRFLATGVAARPRNRLEQGGDCPSEHAWPHSQLGHHVCPRKPACAHSKPKLPSALSATAPIFVPKAGALVLSASVLEFDEDDGRTEGGVVEVVVDIETMSASCEMNLLIRTLSV